MNFSINNNPSIINSIANMHDINPTVLEQLALNYIKKEKKENEKQIKIQARKNAISSMLSPITSIININVPGVIRTLNNNSYPAPNYVPIIKPTEAGCNELHANIVAERGELCQNIVRLQKAIRRIEELSYSIVHKNYDLSKRRRECKSQLDDKNQSKIKKKHRFIEDRKANLKKAKRALSGFIDDEAVEDDPADIVNNGDSKPDDDDDDDDDDDTEEDQNNPMITG
jgi:hypothetical protein